MVDSDNLIKHLYDFFVPLTSNNGKNEFSDEDSTCLYSNKNQPLPESEEPETNNVIFIGKKQAKPRGRRTKDSNIKENGTHTNKSVDNIQTKLFTYFFKKHLPYNFNDFIKNKLGTENYEIQKFGSKSQKKQLFLSLKNCMSQDVSKKYKKEFSNKDTMNEIEKKLPQYKSIFDKEVIEFFIEGFINKKDIFNENFSNSEKCIQYTYDDFKKDKAPDYLMNLEKVVNKIKKENEIRLKKKNSKIFDKTKEKKQTKETEIEIDRDSNDSQSDNNSLLFEFEFNRSF